MAHRIDNVAQFNNVKIIIAGSDIEFPEITGLATQTLSNTGTGLLSWTTPVILGGNTGRPVILGTADQHDLELVTAGISRLVIDSAGVVHTTAVIAQTLQLGPVTLSSADGTAYNLLLPGSVGAAQQSLTTDADGRTAWSYPTALTTKYTENIVVSSITLDQRSLLSADASVHSVVITLPAAIDNRGQIYYITKIDNSYGLVSVQPGPGDLLDRAASAVILELQDDSVNLICGARGWTSI